MEWLEIWAKAQIVFMAIPFVVLVLFGLVIGVAYLMDKFSGHRGRSRK